MEKKIKELSMEEKLERLEWITGYKWGVIPFWFNKALGERYYGWACIREGEISKYLSAKRYLYDPRNKDNIAFEAESPIGAINFTLAALDPDGQAPRAVPHHLGVFGAINSQNQILYRIYVDIKTGLKRVYARAENGNIVIWKDWQNQIKDIELYDFNSFLTNASPEELEEKTGTLKAPPTHPVCT